MFTNFNIEKLDKLIYDFYRVTGLTISVWDAKFHQLSFQPREMQTFCKIIKATDKGKHLCFLSDKKLCTECGLTGNPATHYCHAGLIDTAIPIKFKDSVMGYMMFGQVTDRSKTEMIPILKEISRELNINFNQLLIHYEKLDTYDETRISSAANILKMATRYLWLSDYIEIGHNTTASQIDDYIKSHIRDNISVNVLCDNFGISKNRLYEVSHKWFKMSIGDYIASIRIEEAKRLLGSTDLSINQICDMVGIKDYNYFTKFFKLHVGIPPIKYRKGFPFNLHDKKPT